MKNKKLSQQKIIPKISTYQKPAADHPWRKPFLITGYQTGRVG